MSDGPHRSLPMRAAWKRVAERGDIPAYTPDEISERIVPALEQDWQQEVRPDFIADLTEVFSLRQGLFPEAIDHALQSLSERAQCGLERLLIDRAIHVSKQGEQDAAALESLACNALMERGSRGLLQVEEHYWRKSNLSRARRVRERLQEGLALARTDLAGATRRLLGIDRKAKSASASSDRRDGIDDGVRL
jgi:hypothetical protein